MKRWRRFIGAAILAAGLGVAGWSGYAKAVTHTHQTPPPSVLSRLSTVGVPMTNLTANDQNGLAQFAAHGEGALTAVSQLTTIGDRAFYRVTNAGGSDCFATGPTAVTEYSMGAILCMPSFPSAKQPVLDFTILHGEGDQTMVYRCEGVASDGVAAVALEDGSRNVLAETSVHDNAFYFNQPPKGLVRHLVALDATGAPVWSRDFH
jgi:hypothetical protein